MLHSYNCSTLFYFKPHRLAFPQQDVAVLSEPKKSATMLSSSKDSTPESDAPESEELKYGWLAHIMRGEHNPSEAECFRKLCMRYGLDAWDEMVWYLLWRSRSDL
jgi:hypothetical protein